MTDRLCQIDSHVQTTENMQRGEREQDISIIQMGYWLSDGDWQKIFF